MKRLVAALLVMTGAALPVTAQAQEEDGWYGSVSVTGVRLEPTDGTIANAPAPGSTVRTHSEFETGLGGQVALGHRFGRFRIEAEAGYARSKQNSYVAIVPPTGSIAADVKEDEVRGMVNGYFDLTRGQVQPYLGVGAGVARVDVDFVAPRAPFPTEAPRQLIKDGDTRFAYQLIGGVSVRVGPKIALTLQYRWLDAGTIEARDTRNEAITRDHRGHHLDIGLRLGF